MRSLLAFCLLNYSCSVSHTHAHTHTVAHTGRQTHVSPLCFWVSDHRPSAEVPLADVATLALPHAEFCFRRGPPSNFVPTLRRGWRTGGEEPRSGLHFYVIGDA